jgi:hypothetical protein
MFIIQSHVNPMDDDYEIVKMIQLGKISVYNKGWFTFGMNGKVIYGNNPTLNIKLENHELSSIS